VKRSGGFTLVEVMIAVAISAILSVMAFTAMDQALKNRTRVRASADRLAALQLTIRNLVQDFSQLAPRPVRQTIGDGYLPALLAVQGDATEVTLTREGWMNPAALQRSTLQRVHYVVRDGVLYREYWTVLDAQQDPPPIVRQQLDRVRSFRIRFMNDGRAWQDEWPPQTLQGTRGNRELRWRPLAVEVTLELEDYGKITRLIEVAG
jgi:general secretion pathway protein J